MPHHDLPDDGEAEPAARNRTGGLPAVEPLEYVGKSLVAETRAVVAHLKRRVLALDLHLHLANATSAPDLAQIVSMRLNSEGFETFLTEPQDGRVQLFVQHALFVRLRLGRGLKSIVTLTNSAPGAIKVMPPQGATGAAKLAITSSRAWGSGNPTR